MTSQSDTLPRRAAIAVFLAFALAYFISALLRAVTATLSPVLTDEFSLHARDLGLLAVQRGARLLLLALQRGQGLRALVDGVGALAEGGGPSVLSRQLSRLKRV